jgi:hypothetical protein
LRQPSDRYAKHLPTALQARETSNFCYTRPTVFDVSGTGEVVGSLPEVLR